MTPEEIMRARALWFEHLMNSIERMELVSRNAPAPIRWTAEDNEFLRQCGIEAVEESI